MLPAVDYSRAGSVETFLQGRPHAWDCDSSHLDYAWLTIQDGEEVFRIVIEVVTTLGPRGFQRPNEMVVPNAPIGHIPMASRLQRMGTTLEITDGLVPEEKYLRS